MRQGLPAEADAHAAPGQEVAGIDELQLHIAVLEHQPQLRAAGDQHLGAGPPQALGVRLPGELIKTADEIYVRFHGTTKWYSHEYSKAELTDWAECIKASGAKRVWAYFNNDQEAYAIKNARQLMRL